MGLLVGNTTVIEHAGTYVEYSYTHQFKQYHPVKASIGFIVPKGVAISDGYLLARAIVHTQIGLPVDRPKRADELCLEVFKEPLRNFDPSYSPRNGFVEIPDYQGDHGRSAAKKKKRWVDTAGNDYYEE